MGVTMRMRALQIHAGESMALYPNGTKSSLLHMEPWAVAAQASPGSVRIRPDVTVTEGPTLGAVF